MADTVSRLLSVEKGALVDYNGQEYVVLKVIDLEKVLAKNAATKETQVLDIVHLSPWGEERNENDGKSEIDLLDVEDANWEIARRKLEIVRPMLVRHARGSALVKRLSEETGYSQATLYQWAAIYKGAGTLSSLLPTKPNGGSGKGRVSEEVEAIIQNTLDTYHLTEQRPSIKSTLDRIRSLCRKAGLPPPHWQTVKNRILWKSERLVFEKRHGKRAASQKFDPNEGKIVDAKWPLAMVQIDHTKLPVMVVDEVTRQAIARPWVTLTIDIDSRVVPGMYLTLESPSFMSAGMCISHSILPKEKYLADIGLPDVSWACWGVMGVLHMDNAREFRGQMLKEACNEYDIDSQLRPVKKPHYGGHIERLMGNLSEQLKTLEGATFANPVEKGEYDSEVRATMTMHELEQWLVLLIAKYHRSPHAGINEEAPIDRYRKGLLGGDGRPARGLPARRLDEEKVKIDFMPFYERTVQGYGVVLDDIYYFADVLRPWVNSTSPDNDKLKRVFKFRRDPHDVSRLYFFEPNAKQYYVIPWRNVGRRPISLWELRAAKKAAVADGVKEINEQVIFEYADRQLAIQEAAALKTKAVRRENQRKKEHAKARQKREKDLPNTMKTEKPAMPPAIPGYDPSRTTYFDEDD